MLFLNVGLYCTTMETPCSFFLYNHRLAR